MLVDEAYVWCFSTFWFNMLVSTYIENVMTPEERRELKEKKREENRLKNIERQEAGEFSVKHTARKPIGTSVGNKQRMQEFKERLLHAPTGETIIRKVLTIALDDEHPGQMAAMKMCLDRMLPVAMFEEKKDSGRAAIQINITGIGETPAIEHKDIDDAEVIG